MDLTEITKDLAEIAEIVFGINSAEYDKEIREMPYSESHYENNKRLTLKKINRDYFNDPYYQVECYDFEPITKIDGGGFDDIFKGVKLTGYKTTKKYNRNLAIPFSSNWIIPEESYIFNKAKLKSEIEMCLKLSDFLSNK